MTDGQRIKYLVDNLCGGNQAKFAKATGIEKTIINKLVHGSGAGAGIHLSETYIKRICDAFPEVNSQWLRNGTAEPGDISIEAIRVKYLSIIQERDALIKELQTDNALLKKTLAKLLG